MSRRLVIKFGSGILTDQDGLGLDRQQIASLVRGIASVIRSGDRCVVVSSGAIAAGLMEMGWSERPRGVSQTQAMAAIGQSRLMHTYKSLFEAHDLVPAQLLLTHQDLDSRIRYRNAKNTLDELLRHPTVVPVVNENDSVASEEIKFGDNDELSAEVAVLWQADLLMLLTGVEGLTDKPDGNGRVIEEVTNIEEVAQFVGEGTGKHSVGGMASKLMAAQTAIENGIEVVIASGFTPSVIETIARGDRIGTRFPVADTRRRERDEGNQRLQEKAEEDP